MEPFDTNTAVYKFDNMKSSYDVEAGNEFNVVCTSSGTFSGRVTWMNNGSNSYDSSVLLKYSNSIN